MQLRDKTALITALAYSRGFSTEQCKSIRTLFKLVGEIIEIPEQQFDALTVTFSSSHGYHALATLIAAAETIGLDRKTARLAAAHALADGLAAWRAGDLSIEKLLQEAATPGGTANAVMNSLNAAGYQKLLAQGKNTRR